MASPSSPTFNTQYQVFPSFTGQDGVTSPTPFLLPPFAAFQSGTPIKLGSNIVLQIPLIKTGTIAPYTANTDFTLTDGGSSATVTILGNGNVWTGDPNKRATLMNNFASFLAAVELNYEISSPATLIPGATFRIGQALADAIPAPLLETLFYRYSLSTGFVTGVAYIDVRPGMRLAVEGEIFQYVQSAPKLSGYVPGGRIDCLITSTPTGGGPRVTNFDAFLGTISSPTIINGPANPVIAGGLFDLQSGVMAMPYVRLFYPSSVNPPANTGSLTQANNVGLLAAANLTMLNTATPTFFTKYTVNPLVPPGAAQNVAAIFLGRAMAIPQIPIFIGATARGQAWTEYVPAGTTLGNILQRFIPLPLMAPASAPPPAPQPLSVTLTRNTTAFPLGSTSSRFSPYQVPVDFYGTGLGTLQPIPLPASMFDVPLIAGDSITFSF